jgi:hypothetical protein
VVSARGPAHRRATVVLTRCASGSGRAVRRLRLRADRNGRARVGVRAAGLCVLAVRA